MKTVTQDELRSLLGSGDVVVDFYADWCAPCRALAPELQALADQVSDATFVKLDVDANPEIAQELDVMSIPTVIRFGNDGKEAARTVGAARAADLADRLGLQPTA